MTNRIFQDVLDWIDDENMIMSILKIDVVVAAIASPFIILYFYLGVF